MPDDMMAASTFKFMFSKTWVPYEESCLSIFYVDRIGDFTKDFEGWNRLDIVHHLYFLVFSILSHFISFTCVIPILFFFVRNSKKKKRKTKQFKKF